MDRNSFAVGSTPWLARLGNLRNVVRQETVSRQVSHHLPVDPSGLCVLDVGAGQGTQAIRLARAGCDVTAVEPDAGMRSAFADAVAEQEADVRARLRLCVGGLGDLASALGASPVDGFDVVVCHGVLMYLDSPDAAVAELAELVAPGGVLSLLARNAEAMAWRPASRHDWEGALSLLDEVVLAEQQGRSPFYGNEIGVRARADSRDHLTTLMGAGGLGLETWYGVRIASDNVPVDQPFPADPREATALLDLEERLGRTDPYRQLGTLLHLIGRRARPSTSAPL